MPIYIVHVTVVQVNKGCVRQKRPTISVSSNHKLFNDFDHFIYQVGALFYNVRLVWKKKFVWSIININKIKYNAMKNILYYLFKILKVNEICFGKKATFD